MQEGNLESAVSMGDFVNENAKSKLIVPRLIRILVTAIRKEKLSYSTVKYIYKQVVKRTKLSAPRPTKKLYNLVTSEELNSFFAAIDDQQIKLFFMVLNNTGLRVSEACSILVERIDTKNATVLISGKGSKERIIPLTPKMVERIQLFLSGHRSHHHLFESKLGIKFSVRRIEQICQEVKTKAGITKRLTPHSFRHKFLTSLAEQNVSPDIRALLAGHSSLKTQEVYTHLALGGSKMMILETLEKMETNGILK